MRSSNDQETHNLKTTTMGRYTYGGGFGGNWTSQEWGVAIGTVRVIDEVEHHAWAIHGRGWLRPPTVLWSRTDGKYGLGKEGKP